MKYVKIINFRPLLFMSLSLIAGTIFSYFHIFNGTSLWYLALVLPIVSIVFFTKKPLFYLCTAALCLIMLFGGFFAFRHKASSYINSAVEPYATRIEGRVEKVTLGQNAQTVQLGKITVFGREAKYKLVLQLDDAANFKIGQIIAFNATATNVVLTKQTIGSLVTNLRYYATAKARDVEVIGQSKNIFLLCRQKISITLNQNLGKQADLAAAILLGDTSGVDQDLLSNFRYGGIAHVFSVSGLHITTLAGFLALIFRKVKYKSFFKSLAIFIILLFFSGICGFSPSSVRAAVMCGVYLLYKSAGLRQDGLNALSTAFIVVTFINPANLWDIGFLLSFIVVFFIIILRRPISKLFIKLPHKLSAPLTLTLAASLGSLILLNRAFGYVSFISVLINLLFVPIVSVCFTILFACTLIVQILPFASVIFAIPATILKVCSAVFLWVDFKLFVYFGLSLSAFSFFYYLALIILSDKVNLKARTKVVAVSVLACVFIIGSVQSSLPQKNIATIYVKSQTDNFVIVKTSSANILVFDGLQISAFNLTKAKAKLNINSFSAVILLSNSYYNAAQFAVYNNLANQIILPSIAAEQTKLLQSPKLVYGGIEKQNLTIQAKDNCAQIGFENQQITVQASVGVQITTHNTHKDINFLQGVESNLILSIKNGKIKCK